MYGVSEEKIALYADDILLFLEDSGETLAGAEAIIEEFGSYSGLRINWEKSNMMLVDGDYENSEIRDSPTKLSEHHSGEHKFLCALTSAALCKRLAIGLPRSTGASPPTDDPALLDNEVQILGSAILLHMLQLHCNAQAVTAIHEEYEESTTSLVARSNSSRLATAIFPVLSLLNHSCDPNTSVSFQGRSVMVRASRAIRKGEEVLHCYGPHKLRMKFEKRQTLLKDQYFFTCRCDVCTLEQTLTDDTVTDFCCLKCHSLLKGNDELHCINNSCAHRFRRDEILPRLKNLQRAVHGAQDQLQNNHLGDYDSCQTPPWCALFVPLYVLPWR
ncbi:unnamed protein product [Ranitomeya imitator]|uniref:SET domain-containing protein n=1 Tax=Ranitomeya imitator TaxID=111125 RepID=A0ABN9M268_9NEOB|nr:unnamed protein product [Ranitomeya imitator]